ncbi:MAG TPA: hypothetical protein PLI43_11700 [Albidovulum sp.]|uniref:hypothetical protein n=1 Tax=Albidovulum sp. TaxID=1872424 RepID=UPI002C08035E|nr:hypothetical protein [Albidovulum sp.]
MAERAFTALHDGATGNTEFNGKNLGFAVDEIDINDISAENKLIADGENTQEAIDKHATDWIAAHQADCDGWLAAARAAAN